MQLEQSNTQGAEGKEGEQYTSHNAQTHSSQPSQSLKQCIFRHFDNESVSEKIHSKLLEHEVTELDVLIFSDDKDLDTLCDKLSLSLGNRMKFKALVRKLKNIPSTPRHIAITTREQREINKIESTLKQSQNIQQLLTEYKQEIKEHTITTKTKINQTFNGIIQLLQNRQKTLMQQVDEWETGKLSKVDAEISNMTQFSSNTSKTISEVDDLLTATKCVIEQREQNIIQMTQAFYTKNSLYQTLNDAEALHTYLDTITQLTQVTFDETNTMNEVNKFGLMDTKITNDKYQIPTILLTDVIKSQETNKGFTITLQWDMICTQQHANGDEKTSDATSGFVVKYMKSDDIKSNEWISLDKDNVMIQFLSKNKTYYYYICQVDEYFEYNQQYRFKIERWIKKPVNCKIVSNIEALQCEEKGKLVRVDVKRQEEIRLKVHSVQSHYGEEWKAENVLKSDSSYYCSAKGVVKNDWIIFEYDAKDIYYCPVSIKLKAWDGNSSIQQFNVYIGDTAEDVWIRCNKETFVSDRSQKKGWQIFNLDIVDNNNTDNEANKKFQEIIQNGYRYLTLEILNNHGGTNYVGFYELKLLGVIHVQ